MWGEISIKISRVLDADELDGVIAGSNRYDIAVFKLNGIMTIHTDDCMVFGLDRDCDR